MKMICLRKIMGITKLDKVRNTIIKVTLGAQETVINKVTTKLRYFGHINRMQPDIYPSIVLNGNIQGDRSRGRPPKTWLDCVKTDCTTRQLQSVTEATRLSLDRKTWQASLKQKPSHIQKPMVWTA